MELRYQGLLYQRLLPKIVSPSTIRFRDNAEVGSSSLPPATKQKPTALILVFSLISYQAESNFINYINNFSQSCF